MRKPLLFVLIGLFLFFSPQAKAEFGFHAGAHYGWGRMGNESDSIKTRSMSTFDIQFMPGYRMLGFMGGILFDYRSVSQLTDVVDAGNSDLSGSSFPWGLAATYEFALWKVLFSYDFRARHSASTTNATYKGTGFHLLGGYQFFPGFYADLEFVKMGYNTVEASNGTETDLSSNKLSHWNLAVGISYSY